MHSANEQQIRERLVKLYGDRGNTVTGQCLELIAKAREAISNERETRWDQSDSVLITYGDQISEPDKTPLQTLHTFLNRHQLRRVLQAVHILPFSPYSSDDGFSVIDYRQVDPELGSWDDIHRLGGDFDLMFDLVLNHCSRHSRWFQDYLAGKEPYTRYFIEADPSEDLSMVTRPRSLPLLSPYATNRGKRHVWTTFSADQVDLNFAEPAVLLEMLDILLTYVEHGARIIRLDAIAYLWKEIGTTCIHLPQTHEVVKLMRDVLDAVAPSTILLTETNVPHAENISYFGAGDEAHMVYQFSLPPLLLDAVVNEDATPLKQWLVNLPPAAADTTFFNFTASHDGIGVRPLEGLVSDERLDRLVDGIRQRNGLVNTRRNSDGTDSPYELNISYVDAMSDPTSRDPAENAKRFLASQAIMLALRGIPGIYFHSLVGTPNDLAGVEKSGQNRRINRRKYPFDELEQLLNDSAGLQSRIFNGYCGLLETRIAQPAFHPDAAQIVMEVNDPAIVAFTRTSNDGRQSIAVVANLSRERRVFELNRQSESQDLLTKRSISGRRVELAPFQVAWLSSS